MNVLLQNASAITTISLATGPSVLKNALCTIQIQVLTTSYLLPDCLLTLCLTERMSEGFREQQFTCHYLNGTQTNNEKCLERMEEAGIDRRSVCGSRPCRPVRYLLGTWGECDCGTKIRMRTVTCTDFEGISVEDDFCTALGIPKPRTAEYCLPEKC